ncbi:MAG: cytochrome C [Gammaproteobacteria bacterium]|nr:cytochrome C [Gammaproteobacteria bacterium]MDH5800676.1 cytochrome C [Gammaproteobacteria bacterium]
MKQLITLLMVSVFFAFGSSVIAVPQGMNVEFVKSPMGKVTFKGDSHAGKGITCEKCHPVLFQMKKGTTQIKLTDHEAGTKFCFSCHNGKPAFAPKDNCNKCHQAAK